MEQVLSFIQQNSSLILLWMTGIIVLFFLFIIVILVRLSKLNKKYKLLTNRKGDKSLEELVTEHNIMFNSYIEDVESLETRYKEMDLRLKNCIQKVGIIRYNAFYDTGSDQSFSIAFLDHNNNGVVMSGIFGRNESTTYAKPIANLESKYTLSQEEAEALKKAAGEGKGV